MFCLFFFLLLVMLLVGRLWAEGVQESLERCYGLAREDASRGEGCCWLDTGNFQIFCMNREPKQARISDSFGLEIGLFM